MIPKLMGFDILTRLDCDSWRCHRELKKLSGQVDQVVKLNQLPNDAKTIAR